MSRSSEVHLAPPDWKAALEEARGAKAVILSNHYVRYALLPWSDTLETAEEEQAYARHQFTRIFGERAAAWEFRASPGGADGMRLASAVDIELMQALRQSLAGLASVQPALMAVYNHHRSKVPAEGAWLVLLEPGRACIALHGREGWQSVRNARLLMEDAEAWLALLDQERRRIGGELPDLVLLHAAGEIGIPEAPGWRFEVLAHASAA